MLTSKVKCYWPALPYIHPVDIEFLFRPLDCPVTTEEHIPRVSFMIPRVSRGKEERHVFVSTTVLFSQMGLQNVLVCVL